MTQLALLRGINVGGKNMLPMKDLARIFEQAGCANVRTYIQSGNVIFDAPKGAKVGEAVTRSIEKKFGYRVPVILRTASELDTAIRDNPFLRAGVDTKMLHVYFLGDRPSASCCASLDATRSAPDAFEVRGREIYLHMPNGTARTKLTNAYFDSKLATISTSRNWRTTTKLLELMTG